MLDDNDLLSIDGIESVDASFNNSDGGFKQVFKCLVDNKDNVVKITKVVDRGGVDDIGIKRLKRELELMDSLSSPFLPELGDLPLQRFDKDGNTFIIYSEKFIEGSDVLELLRSDVFSDPQKIRKLIHDICSAVQQYWNNNETIHRDIKPGNIRFSNQDNNFILLDAGIAFIRKRTRITPSGHGSPGTPLYISPEIIKHNRNLSFRTDLFSLGVVVYEASTGQHPFYQRGMNKTQLYDAILNNNPTSIHDLRDDLEAEVQNTIMKMIAKRPHSRPNNLSGIINLTS